MHVLQATAEGRHCKLCRQTSPAACAKWQACSAATSASDALGRLLAVSAKQRPGVRLPNTSTGPPDAAAPKQAQTSVAGCTSCDSKEGTRCRSPHLQTPAAWDCTACHHTSRHAARRSASAFCNQCDHPGPVRARWPAFMQGGCCSMHTRVNAISSFTEPHGGMSYHAHRCPAAGPALWSTVALTASRQS